MGYVNRNIRRPWLVLDIETAPILEIDQYADDVRIDSRLKDPEKIAEAKAAALAKVAVDIDLLRVVAVGAYASDLGALVWTAGEMDEAAMLTAAWAQYTRVVIDAGGAFVTHNGIGFDVPALIRRSQYLGIDYPRGLDLNKYRPGAHIDLQNELSFNGAKPFRSLSFYCRRFGIAADIPDDSSGADMGAMVEAGDWGGVHAHCLADIRRTQALAQRLGYLCAPVPAHAGDEVAF